MYNITANQLKMYSFNACLQSGLDQNNRWVKLADLIPWPEIEIIYAGKFKSTGRPAKPLRLVLGAYIIKNEYKASSAAVIQHIKENPYLQYFIGLDQFVTQPDISVSLLDSFKNRFTKEEFEKIERDIAQAWTEVK